MKKTLITLVAIMAAFFMISCQNETSSENNEDTKKDTTAEKIEVYNKLVGTSWKTLENDEKWANYKTYSFNNDSVAINGVSYSINLEKDLFFPGELPEDAGVLKNLRAPLTIRINGDYYSFKYYTLGYYELGEYKSKIHNDLGIYINYGDSWLFESYDLVSNSSSSSDSSTSSESVTVSGKYNAKGSKSGASTTFTNGTWTFSYLSSSKTGSYSQSGNELTIKYSTGSVSASAVFTVSKGDSDNVVNLKGKSGDIATIVSNVFSTTDSDALTNGNVILTVN